ncbi:hemagglutinin repeat-containing protein [Noviherbaspirillum pedocola]|uniref:Hemagglutinin repeat-containing protein n=1 Tax=Noviherbaspirillum pedocola TaxID=2801341 RepID=A0A934W6R8_9BURK|nr:hemagglutinin repeat-containing protein [Noviherbaspirillum pedocola]MBK4736542.1 hemagglutinin repeat-containing protein [Noviherbaspirillum pedocola]
MNRHASMNRSFRLIWSAARGAYLVAPETARAGGRASRAILAAATLLTAGLTQAQVTPVPGNAGVANAANGVPVVNIVNPNGAGLSHNRYDGYNVDARGLVLNNGMQQSVTSLAGAVAANPNLNASARVILNEVVSPNRSTLAGFTEVDGVKADVVVANPYGITCAGCGFLNTDRVTLSTGMPNFGADGSLTGFRVSSGDVLIRGDGLNASAQQLLDIVTRSVRIDGAVHASDSGSIGIVTGGNAWDYASREVTGRTVPQGAAPGYAIDTSALGGMYAGRIRLTATEAGVGVRMLGEAAARVDDIRIDAAGGVELLGKLAAARDIAIARTADAAPIALSNGGEVLASGRFSFDGGTLVNRGWIQGSGVTVRASTAFANNPSGTLLSTDTGSDVVIDAAGFNNGGKLQSAGALRVTTPGDLINRGTMLALDPSGRGSLLGAANLQNIGTISMLGSSGINLAYGLDNSGLLQGQNMALDIGSTLTNRGRLFAEGALHVRGASAQVDNTGRIEAAGDLTLGEANVALGKISNGAGATLLGRSLQFKVSGLDNAGLIQGNAGVDIAASGAFANAASGRLLQTGADAALRIAARRVDNAGEVLSAGSLGAQAAEDLINQGTMQANGTLSAIAGAVLDNDGPDAQMISTGGDVALQAVIVENNGRLQAARHIDAKATRSVLNTGVIMNQLTSSDLTLAGASFDNTGTIQSAGAANLAANAGVLTNRGMITIEGELGMYAGEAIQNLGAGSGIQSGGTMRIAGSNDFALRNEGRIQAGALLDIGDGSLGTLANEREGVLLGDELNIAGDDIDNRGSMGARRKAQIRAKTLANSGQNARIVAGDTRIAASGAVSNEGAIHGDAGLEVKASGIANRRTGGMSSQGDTNLEAARDGIANEGALYAGGTLRAKAAQTVSNGADATMDARDIAIDSARFVNRGSVDAKRDIAIRTSESFANLPIGDMPEIVRDVSTSEAKEISYAKKYNSGDPLGAFGYTEERVYEVVRTVTEELVGKASPQGKIIAGNKLDIDYGKSGENRAGILSAREMRIGSGAKDAQAFVNQDLHVEKTESVLRYKVVHTFKNVWREEHDYTYYYPTSDAEALDATGKSFSGVTKNNSAPVDRGYWRETQRETVGGVDSGIYAGKLDFKGGTLRNQGSPYQAKVKAIDARQLAAVSAASQKSVEGVAMNGAGAAAIGGLALIKIALPTNPNGYFVKTRTPGARYLIETNPLFVHGSGGATKPETPAGISPAAPAARPSESGAEPKRGADAAQQTRNAAANGVGPSDSRAVIDVDAGGSDYLVQQLGQDPNALTLRLGDANYEQRLIREQLVAETGRNLLQGQGSESAQFQQLMDRAAEQASAMGLRLGLALTRDQAAKLKHDMLWLVEQNVEGHRVLVPVVYLSQATKDSIVKGAVIAADDMRINATALENRGGTIQGGKLDISAQNDVKNLSGQIRGREVSVASRAGSVINDSAVDADRGTVGKRAAIVSDAGLAITAARNVQARGADVAAGGDATIRAGERVDIGAATRVEQRVVTKEESGRTSKTSTEVTTTRAAEGAEVVAGGKLDIAAGREIAVTGSSVSAQKDVSLEAGERIRVDGARDVTNRTSTEIETGKGVGGGVYGTRRTDEREDIDRNAASDIKAGGNLSASAGSAVLVRGSTLAAGGDMALAADAVRIEAGEDRERRSTTTQTTTFLKTDSSSETSTNAKAQAAASSEGLSVDKRSRDIDGKTVASETATRKRSGSASTEIEAGKDAKPDPKRKKADEQSESTTNTQTRGALTDDRGRRVVNASDKQDSNRSSRYDDGSANRRASASASSREDSVVTQGDMNAQGSRGARELSGEGKASASASASASADARGKAGVAIVESSTHTERSDERRAAAATLDAGGALKISGRKAVVLQGAQIDAGGNADISGGRVDVLAARNEKTESSSSTVVGAGFFIDSKNNASASASAKASAEGSGEFSVREAAGTSQAPDRVSAKGAGKVAASADAKAATSSNNNVDLVRAETEDASSTEITHQASAIRSGGVLAVRSTGALAVEGSELSGEKGVALSAKDMQFRAAQDSKTTSTRTSHTTGGLYLDAGANAAASASVDASGRTGVSAGDHGALNQDSLHAGASGELSAKASASAEAKAGAGLQFQRETAGEDKSSTTAKVTTIRSGSGDIERNAEGRILDVGTSIDAAGDFRQRAQTIESRAAANTESGTTNSGSDAGKLGAYAKAGAGASASASFSGAAGAGYTGNQRTGEQSVDTQVNANASVGGEAQYQHKEGNKLDTSSTAVVSSVKAGGRVTSVSTGTTTLEGTKISGRGVELEAATLDARAAANTRSSSETSIDGQGKINAGANVGTDGAASGAISGSFEKNSKGSSASEAVVASITAKNDLTIRTGGDARLEGTKLNAGGDARLDVGGKLDAVAARSTTSKDTEKIRAAASVSSVEADGKKGAGLEGEYAKTSEASSKAMTVDIASGGNLAIATGGDARLEGAQLKAGGNTDLDVKGKLKVDAARDTASSESISASGKLKLGMESATDEKKREQNDKKSFSLDAKGKYAKTDSDTAVTATMQSGGNLRVRAGGDAELEGADLRAGGKADVAAGRDLQIRAAQDNSTSTEVSGDLKLSTSRKTTSALDDKGQATPGNVADGNKQILNLSGDYATSSTRRGGTIHGGSVDMAAGRDLGMEGGAVKAQGEVGMVAGRNLTLDAAKSTENSIGGSLNGKRVVDDNTIKTDKNESSTKAGAAVRGGFNEGYEGTALTGERVRLQSGGKTAMTNTEIRAERGGVIDAGSGVERATKQDRGQTLNLSASGSSKTGGTPQAKEAKPEWTAAKPTTDAKPADAKPGPVIGATRKVAEKKPVIGQARGQAAAKKAEAKTTDAKKAEAKKAETKTTELKTDEAKKAALPGTTATEGARRDKDGVPMPTPQDKARSAAAPGPAPAP